MTSSGHNGYAKGGRLGPKNLLGSDLKIRGQARLRQNLSQVRFGEIQEWVGDDFKVWIDFLNIQDIKESIGPYGIEFE